jgi:hypothetical protein
MNISQKIRNDATALIVYTAGAVMAHFNKKCDENPGHTHFLIMMVKPEDYIGCPLATVNDLVAELPSMSDDVTKVFKDEISIEVGREIALFAEANLVELFSELKKMLAISISLEYITGGIADEKTSSRRDKFAGMIAGYYNGISRPAHSSEPVLN